MSVLASSTCDICTAANLRITNCAKPNIHRRTDTENPLKSATALNSEIGAMRTHVCDAQNAKGPVLRQTGLNRRNDLPNFCTTAKRTNWLLHNLIYDLKRNTRCFERSSTRACSRVSQFPAVTPKA